MNIIKSAYKVFLEAVFPFSNAEKELFSFSPEEAYKVLPKAPDFSGLAVPLPDVYSVFAYKDERVSKLIWNIKYKKSAEAVTVGGYALSMKILDMNTHANILLVPVPISDKRRRERGFNQCELLVDAVRFTAEKNLLLRPDYSKSQTLKGRYDRVESAQNIFTVDGEILKKYSAPDTSLNYDEIFIIVVDDVITTGSTMKAAIDTLKDAGFRRVFGLSLAH